MLGVLALSRAPRVTLAVIFVLALLVRFEVVDGERLPGAGAIAAASAAVKDWQAERIHAGACYYRGVTALNDGDLERLDAVSSECDPRSGGPGS